MLNPGFRDRAECDATARGVARGLREGEGGGPVDDREGGEGGIGERCVGTSGLEIQDFKPFAGRRSPPRQVKRPYDTHDYWGKI